MYYDDCDIFPDGCEYRSCMVCGESFPEFGLNRVVCSEQCEIIYEKYKHKKPITKWCVVCDRKFTTNYYPKETCSLLCSDELKKKKRTYMHKRSRYIIFARDGFQCAYCGRTSYEDGIKLAVDHIYPHSRGGDNIASNLITSCEECNISKFNKPIDLRRILMEVKRRNEKIHLHGNTIIFDTRGNKK